MEVPSDSKSEICQPEHIWRWEQLRERLLILQRMGSTPPAHEIRSAFDDISRTLTQHGLNYGLCLLINQVASELFRANQASIQTVTFEVMKKLIAAVADEPKPIVDNHGPVLGELLRFYFSSVFKHSRTSRHVTKAAEQVEQYSRMSFPYRHYALGAFLVTDFERFPVINFEKEAVKNLLIVISRKIQYNPNEDPLMPGLQAFIDSVCHTHQSCGVVIHLCVVLKLFYESIALSQNLEHFRPLQRSPVFALLRGHMTSIKNEAKCWEAILDFLKTSVLCADEDTNNFFLTPQAFVIIDGMFRNHRKTVIDRLLQLIEAVCNANRPRDIDCILRNHILISVLMCVAATDPPRRYAINAFNAFINVATPAQAADAAEYGVVRELLRKTRSSSTQVVLEVLKWLFLLMDKIAESAEAYDGLKTIVTRVGGEDILRKLAENKHMLIKPAARIILSRLEDDIRELENLPDAEHRIRLAQRSFFVNGIPPFGNLGVRVDD